ncbi:MAG: selenocysteine-specific translation elongation factor [Planctomycetales bacterium]|nr:selenocysteine-specific translation elongation factor [Planctomycetales bacterium]
MRRWPLDEPLLARVVIGTAGHIDHGKSTLVKTLTGTDPDRLKEEQERGMTIDLGYADMLLSDGRRVGLIDVPGHEKFVKNMVAGATGVDLVLLVIAADDGVMPQTREHLQILDLLGIGRGIVALTKVDMVDAEMRELAILDVRGFLAEAGSPLADAPIVAVSSMTGEGIPQLRAEIEKAVARISPPPTSGLFRMSVQRAFSAKGHGTVVTGVPVGGEVRVGDRVEILPTDEQGKVRGIQAYGHPVSVAAGGQRAALQISDVGVREVTRGMVVAAPGYFTPSTFVEVRLRHLPGRGAPLKSQTQVRFHVGTAEVIGSLLLLDRPDKGGLPPGETALAQLRLEEPVVCAEGDRFILRQPSPAVTLGGGLVIGVSGRKIRAGKERDLERLRARVEALGKPRALLALALSERGMEPSSEADLRRAARLPAAAVSQELRGLLASGEAVALGKTERVVHRDAHVEARKSVLDALGEFHRANPLRVSADVGEIRTASRVPEGLFDPLLADLVAAGTVADEKGKVRLASHRVTLTSEDAAAAEALGEVFRKGALHTPTVAEAIVEAGLDPARGERLFNLLRERGEVLVLKDDVVLHRETVEGARERVIREIREKGELESASFRDALGTTRKYAIPLLEHFDQIGLTVRVESKRFLREHRHTARRKEGDPA